MQIGRKVVPSVKLFCLFVNIMSNLYICNNNSWNLMRFFQNVFTMNKLEI